MHKVEKSQEIQGFEKIKGDKNTMIKVLFLCHGNICRSTMAQYVFQDMINKAGLSNQFYIDSAATSTEEIGSGVHHGTRRKLAEAGVPCGNHKARQITKADYDNFDYIIGMDSANIRNISRIVGFDKDKKIYKLLQFAGMDADIEDPWYTGNFDVTYDDVVKGCNGLLNKINSKLHLF